MPLESIGSPLLWTGFIVFIVAMLALDLGVLHRSAHKVEFRLSPNSRPLYVTLAAQALGLVLLGVLVFAPSKRDEPTAVDSGKPAAGKAK